MSEKDIKTADRRSSGGMSFRREADRQMYEMAQNAMSAATAAINKIEQHEAVCTERYGHTKDSLIRLADVPLAISAIKLQNRIILGVIGAGTMLLLGAMATMTWAFMSHAFNL